MDFDQHEQWHQIIYIVVLQEVQVCFEFSFISFISKESPLETRPLVSIDDDDPLIDSTNINSDPNHADNFGKYIFHSIVFHRSLSISSSKIFPKVIENKFPFDCSAREKKRFDRKKKSFLF